MTITPQSLAAEGRIVLATVLGSNHPAAGWSQSVRGGIPGESGTPGLTVEQLDARVSDGFPVRYCMITGRRSGVFVVETDVNSETGEMVGETSLRAAGALPPCRTMRTPSGSIHYHFAYPDLPAGHYIKTQAGVLPGVDVRGDGGQVLAFDEGRRVWDDGPLPEAPMWLLELVVAQVREPREIGEAREFDGVNDPNAREYMERAIDGYRDLAWEGDNWAHAFHKAVFAIAGLCAAGFLDEELARSAILDGCSDPAEAEQNYLDRSWDKGYAEPWDKFQGADSDTAVTLTEEAPVPPTPPFPVDALPPELARIVAEGARSICCPPDYIGAAGLVILGAVIGGGTELALTGDWRERPALWVAIVGEPGARKTPALKPLLKPVFVEQKRLFDTARLRREAEKQAAQDEKRAPNRIKVGRVHVDDATVEALCGILEDNPDGVLMHADELAGWVRGMGQYKGGLGRDRQHWLSTWAGSPLTVDRKGADCPVFVPNPFVAVVGGIQPDVLGDVAQNRDDGLLERLLLARGEAVPVVLTQDSISSAALADYEALWGRLRAMTASGGETVRMRPDAWDRFEEWHNTTMREMESGSPMLRGVWAKMPAQCARIALILNRCTPRQGSVDVETIDRAIRLAEYFKGQIRAVLMGAENSTPAEKEYAARLDKLVEWVGGHPGATERDILRSGPKWARKKAVLEQALADLRGAGRL